MVLGILVYSILVSWNHSILVSLCIKTYSMPAFYSVLHLCFLFMQETFLQDTYFEIMSSVNWSALGNLAREKEREDIIILHSETYRGKESILLSYFKGLSSLNQNTASPPLLALSVSDIHTTELTPPLLRIDTLMLQLSAFLHRDQSIHF